MTRTVSGISARSGMTAKRIFWKINHYDRTLTKGSEDPQQTVRVLAINAGK